MVFPVYYNIKFKREYDKIIVESGVDFSFFTSVYDVIVDNGRVDSVILGSKSGLFAVKAKIYIDCTGDGDLCAFGGADYEIGDENGVVMPQTLCSIWTDIDKEKCIGCGRCAKVCPANCIEKTDYIAPGHKLASFAIDPAKCVKCGACMEKCKPHAIYKD